MMAVIRTHPGLVAVVASLLACATLAMPACRRETRSAPAGSRYPLRGTVVSVDAPNRSLVVAHEEIPGFMEAMTMEFVVLEKDQALLAGVAPGDGIAATLVVPDSRYWLEELKVTRRGSAQHTPTRRSAEARLGEPLPEVTLLDQDGQPLRLAELAGRPYAITFIFTRCPLPDFCPLLMSRFAEADALLEADPALRPRARLLTVSFDTKHDTPPVLRAFGLRYQKTHPPFVRWRLATGTDEAIRTLGAAVELDYVEETRSFTHNLRTAVVDRQGRLARLFRGSDWQSRDLVEALRQADR